MCLQNVACFKNKVVVYSKLLLNIITVLQKFQSWHEKLRLVWHWP